MGPQVKLFITKMVAKTPQRTPNKKKGNKVTNESDIQIKKTQGGKISKNAKPAKPPMAKKTKEHIKAARMALAEGKISTEEGSRKHAMDLRTLYVRFKKNHPEDEGQVRERLANHPEIKFVRIPRQGSSNKDVRYAFVEFGSEAQCEEAKESLTKGPDAKDDFYVDFVGVKSKGGGKPTEDRGKKNKRPINPNRLFIAGLVDGLTEDKLKQLFPKCVGAEVKGQKKGGKGFAFVQFSNPADAKAAFDASQKLNISGKSGTQGHHMTVVYARMGKSATKAATTDKKAKKSKSKASKDGKSVTDSAVEEVKGEDEVKSEDGEEKSEQPKEEDKEVDEAKEEDGGQEESEDDEGDEEMENDAESSGGEEEVEAASEDEKAKKVKSKTSKNGESKPEANPEGEDEESDNDDEEEEEEGDEEMENDAESSDGEEEEAAA